MKRGDVVSIALAGDFGKPRPAVVVQSDALDDSGTVLVCLITGATRAAAHRRVDIAPDANNGLLKPSQVMVEKMFAVKREKVGETMGRLDRQTMTRLGESLALVVGLFDA